MLSCGAPVRKRDHTYMPHCELPSLSAPSPVHLSLHLQLSTLCMPRSAANGRRVSRIRGHDERLRLWMQAILGGAHVAKHLHSAARWLQCCKIARRRTHSTLIKQAQSACQTCTCAPQPLYWRTLTSCSCSQLLRNRDCLSTVFHWSSGRGVSSGSWRSCTYVWQPPRCALIMTSRAPVHSAASGMTFALQVRASPDENN